DRRGGPGDAAPDRPHPGRRVRGGERRGGRGGEQLPVQRVTGGDVVAVARGGRDRADAAARVGRLLQPRRDAAAAGGGFQHVVGQPGELSRSCFCRALV